MKGTVYIREALNLRERTTSLQGTKLLVHFIQRFHSKVHEAMNMNAGGLAKEKLM